MLVILDPEQWMDLRRFRALHAAGVPIAEIARETGHDWKTVKKYLADDAPSCPPAAPPRAGTQLLGERELDYSLEVGVRYLFRLQ